MYPMIICTQVIQLFINQGDMKTIKSFYVLAFLCLLSTNVYAQKSAQVKVIAEPVETAIFINNNFVGNGYAEFNRPKRNEVVVIRLECNEYTPITTKFYGSDKRASISYTLQQDGFYRSSAVSGIVNKYFTVDIDSLYYRNVDQKIDIEPAWKLLHQILLNYFDEIETSDIYGGYLQTPWQYKQFNMSNKQIRNRVTVRDISTPSKPALQIKISSEVAGVSAARHGEFTEIDRIPKEFETIIQELQTRIGKAHNY